MSSPGLFARPLPREKAGMVSPLVFRIFPEGIGRKCSRGSIANTPATETPALMASLSCIQTYKKIWAERHSTDTTSVNNAGNKEVSQSRWGCPWTSQCVVLTVPFDPPPSSLGDAIT